LFFFAAPHLASAVRIRKRSLDMDRKNRKVWQICAKVKPVEWFEFLTPVEIEEFKNMDFK
jgi:hypothetical protein